MEGVRTLGTQEAVERMREAGAGANEGFTNVHGVEVNPSTPGAYEWRIPGTDQSYPVAHGGSSEAQVAWAKAQIANDPTKLFLVATPIRDSLGVVIGTRVDAWDAGLDGVPRLNEGLVNPNTGEPLPPPDPRDFIRKLTS